MNLKLVTLVETSLEIETTVVFFWLLNLEVLRSDVVKNMLPPRPPRKWRNISWKNAGWKVLHFLLEMVPFLFWDIRKIFRGVSWNDVVCWNILEAFIDPCFGFDFEAVHLFDQLETSITLAQFLPWKVWPRGTWEKSGKQKHINHGIP